MKQSFYYFHVYILLCKDASFYVGHTDNLEQRLADHKAGTYSGFTSTRLPVQLIWSDHFSSRDEAFEAEHQIKNWSRKKKIALINGEWELLKQSAKKEF